MVQFRTIELVRNGPFLSRFCGSVPNHGFDDAPPSRLAPPRLVSRRAGVDSSLPGVDSSLPRVDSSLPGVDSSLRVRAFASPVAWLDAPSRSRTARAEPAPRDDRARDVPFAPTRRAQQTLECVLDRIQ